VPDVQNALEKQVIPLLRQQQGFVDVVESLNSETGQFVCMSIWKTQEDSERWGEKFTQLAAGLQPLVEGQVTVSTGRLETSTPHNVAHGKAA
jgi:heme-degrading monooxygenase HmoA